MAMSVVQVKSAAMMDIPTGVMDNRAAIKTR